MADEPRWQLAGDEQVRRRARAISALVAILEPDPEYRPWFLSDEASAFECCLESEEEMRRRLASRFGVAAGVLALHQPLWALADDLEARFPRWWAAEPVADA